MKYITIYLSLLLMIVFSRSKAQQLEVDELCGTTEAVESPGFLEEFQRWKLQNSNISNERDALAVPLRIYIVQDDDGTNGIDAATIDEAMTTLNERFALSRISFFQCDNKVIIRNTAINDLSNPISNSEDFDWLRDNGFYDEDRINVYFVNSLAGGGAGFGLFPRHGINMSGITNTVAGNGSTFAHEMGHVLGLYHTHSTANGRERVSRTDNPNCETAGDMLCDTPADPRLSTRNVNQKCEYTGNAVDAIGDEYTPSPTNLMSYARRSCREDFSPDQMDKMRFVLETERSNLMCVQAVSSSLANLRNMPPNIRNERFGIGDLFDIVRPALSIRGFDSDELQDDSNFGLGLKQILLKVFEPSPTSENEPIKEVYKKIVKISKRPMRRSIERSDIEENSRILQSKAFVALVSYVLEKNGNDMNELNGIFYSAHHLPTHIDAINSLKEGMLNPPNGRIDLHSDIEEDGVKWVKSLANIARTWDLYLALENAYKHYDLIEFMNHNSLRLLTKKDRKDFHSMYGKFIHKTNDEAKEDIVFGLISVDEDEVQPGNWPMKMHATIGYAALGMQGGGLSEYDNYLDRAVRSTGEGPGHKITRHWMYQTLDGKAIWAEGPFYFHYALSDVVPFWHALRGNCLLDYKKGDANFSMGDPFFSSWFNQPLIWLAMLATPDGLTAPIDDGKKKPIVNSGILRWDHKYGNLETGRRFAWVNNRLNFARHLPQGKPAYGSNENMLLVEIAIPRTAEVMEPPLEYGNNFPFQTGELSKNYLVIRSENRNHYLLMVGESGDAITNAEGHEQPDQLQILYYVGKESLLMDAGYGSTPPTKNDGRNKYFLHNTMSMDYSKREYHDIISIAKKIVDYENRGGMESPKVIIDIWDGEYRKKISHPDAKNFFYDKFSKNLILLQGQVQLQQKRGDNIGGNKRVTAEYYRKIILVKDNAGSFQYFIDLNTLERTSGNWNKYRMRYHFPKYPYSNRTYTNLFDHKAGWDFLRTPNQRLYGYLAQVERDASAIQSETNDEFEEYERLSKKAHRWQLDANMPHFNTVGFFSAPGSNQHPDYLPQPIIPYRGEDLAYQVWLFPQGDLSMDVLIKRSKINEETYDQPLSLNIIHDNFSIQALELEAGVDFGFARFRLDENQQWDIDPNYSINLDCLAKHCACDVFVNLDYPDSQPMDGTRHQPYNTVELGEANTKDSEILCVQAGKYVEEVIIDVKTELIQRGGTVTIGKP